MQNINKDDDSKLHHPSLVKSGPRTSVPLSLQKNESVEQLMKAVIAKGEDTNLIAKSSIEDESLAVKRSLEAGHSLDISEHV